jgi:hypothetical protein
MNRIRTSILLLVVAVGPGWALGGVASATRSAATRPTTSKATFPDETSTGPSRAIDLRKSEGIKVVEANAVVEGLEVSGRILVTAPNVIIRNCRITASAGEVAVKIAPNIIGTVIEDCEITGHESSNGVSGSNYVARRLHIHHMGSDAFRVMRNVTIERCYVHDVGILPKSHGDIVQMYPPDGGNITILENHFDARGGNAALFQVQGGWRVEGNYLNGGNYTVQCEGAAENKFLGNTFGPDAKYGPIRVGRGEPQALLWDKNVDAQGREVSRPAAKHPKKE